MKKYLFFILMIITLFMCNKVYAYKQYNLGDLIIYRGEKYYVMYDSDLFSDYVVLLKADVLTKEQVNKYGEDYYSEDGEYPYYISSTCSNYRNYSGCSTDYNTSNIKKVIDSWSSEFSDDLVEIDQYKARLINTGDLTNTFKYVIEQTDGSKEYLRTENTPFWISVIYNKTYWTMENDNNKIFCPFEYVSNVYNEHYIRPVINVNKCSLNDNDKNCQKKENITSDEDSLFNDYKIGDKIYYNNESYHVIADSNGSSNYITLLKDNPLTYDELNIYGRDSENNLFINKYLNNSEIENITVDGNIFGGMSYITRYYCSDSSYIPDKTKVEPFEYRYCISDYDSSNVRRTINKWIKNFENDLVSVDGYKARLINFNELYYNLEYDSSKEISDLKYNWLYSDKYKYWSMISLSDSLVLDIPFTNSLEHNIIDKNAVRPVINLNKCAVEKDNINCEIYYLNNSCSSNKEIKYKEYKVGDEILYKGDKYYVIENSNIEKNYVTLLKDDSLTLDDIPSYKDNILEYVKNDTQVGTSYYSCNDDTCSLDYDTSDVKKIVDNWAKNELDEDDLVSVDGYKARILSSHDLFDNLNFTIGDAESNYPVSASTSTPDIFYDYSSWTMSSGDESYLRIIKNKAVDISKLNELQAVNPVINLKKEKLGTAIDYVVGEEVKYKDEIYYVIEDSDETKNYVTLLLYKPLNKSQIELYRNDNLTFTAPYYVSDDCISGVDVSGCSTSYERSEIKKIIDIWSSDFTNDLVDIDGYKTRLITKHELIYNLDYDMQSSAATSYIYCNSVDTPLWVYNKKYAYWTMEPYEDFNYLVFQNFQTGCLNPVMFGSINLSAKTFDTSTIRPVININKCAIGGCYESEECINEDGQNIVTVENTLKNISKVLLILCSILIFIGLIFIGYNYLKYKKERK